MRDIFDPVGHHGQPQSVGEVDNGGNDQGIVGVVAERGHEVLVDLDHVDRELLQVGQRRIAGAEVVQGHSYPQLAQAGERGEGGVGIAHQRCLGDLD